MCLRTSNGVFLFCLLYLSKYFVLTLAIIYIRFEKFNGVNGGMVRYTDTWCRPLRPSERTQRSHFAKQIF